jgi:hypothetical protein
MIFLQITVNLSEPETSYSKPLYLITGFVKGAARHVSPTEQKRLTRPAQPHILVEFDN